jgi:hypothetical protein
LTFQSFIQLLSSLFLLFWNQQGQPKPRGQISTAKNPKWLVMGIFKLFTPRKFPSLVAKRKLANLTECYQLANV